MGNQTARSQMWFLTKKGRKQKKKKRFGTALHISSSPVKWGFSTSADAESLGSQQSFLCH